MSVVLIFGSLFVFTGVVESIQEKIYYAKKAKAYNMRRWRAKNRWIM